MKFPNIGWKETSCNDSIDIGFPWGEETHVSLLNLGTNLWEKKSLVSADANGNLFIKWYIMFFSILRNRLLDRNNNM